MAFGSPLLPDSLENPDVCPGGLVAVEGAADGDNYS